MKIRSMCILGITGGVATGKSTVLHMLAELGAPIISADAIAHQLLAPGTAATRAVLAAFPSCFLPGQTSPAIDRRALGLLVFNDPKARRCLELLTHPQIIARLEDQAAEWRSQKHLLAAAEIPLLFEAGLEYLSDKIVVVTCEEETQRKRISARIGFDTAMKAEAIAAMQWPLSQKTLLADYLISTEESVEQTKQQVEALWTELV